MFYSHKLLARKAPLGQIWTAATMHAKIHRGKLDKHNIIKKCEEILIPPRALRLSGILMDDVTCLLVKFNEAWKVKSAPSDPTRLPMGKSQAKYESLQLPPNRYEDLGEIEEPKPYSNTATKMDFQQTSYFALRLDSMDDPFLNQNLEGDQEQDHHQAEIANITLNDNYDSHQADTTTFNHFESFDVEGEEEMQWNFIQPEHTGNPSIIPSTTRKLLARRVLPPLSEHLLLPAPCAEEFSVKDIANNKGLSAGWRACRFKARSFPLGPQWLHSPYNRHFSTNAQLERLDSMDDHFLNQNLQGDQEQDHHQAEVANITLNDNYDSHQADTTTFNHFERFAIEGDEEMQWNFTQPEHTGSPIIITSPRLPKGKSQANKGDGALIWAEENLSSLSSSSNQPSFVNSLVRSRVVGSCFGMVRLQASFPLAHQWILHQSRHLSTTPPTPPLEDTEVTVEGDAQQWPPLLPSTFPKKGILRVQSDGAYRWKPDKIAGEGYWIRYEFKTTRKFLCAHHCKGEGHPNLLSTNLTENRAGEKGIYRALELHPRKILVVSDNEYFCRTMKSCLQKGCYPDMPGHKNRHEEIDHLKKLECRESICRILNKLPEDILIKIEQIESENNKLAHVLAALGLQGQRIGKFHYSIEEIKAEYNRRWEEIEAMADGDSKKEEKQRLGPLKDSDWNKIKEATEIPTASEVDFIRWKGIKGGRK